MNEAQGSVYEARRRAELRRGPAYIQLQARYFLLGGLFLVLLALCVLLISAHHVHIRRHTHQKDVLRMTVLHQANQRFKLLGRSASPTVPPSVPPTMPTVPGSTAYLSRVLVNGTFQPPDRLRILYFTMDVLTWWRDNAKVGGPKGEIVVTDALLKALGEMNHTVVVATSDDEFRTLSEHASEYDLFIMDEFTFLDEANQPRSFIMQRPEDLLMLSFFGDVQIPDSSVKGRLRPYQILTAMDLGTEKERVYLGFYLHEDEKGTATEEVIQKDSFGLIWGKGEDTGNPRLLEILQTAASRGEVRTHFTFSQNNTLTTPVGMLSREQFREMLRKARFLLGTGDPLLGPSALEAVQEGCFLIIPRFDPPRLIHNVLPAKSQHDFVTLHTPEDRYCLYNLDQVGTSLNACLDRAMARTTATQFAYPQLSWRAYYERVRSILSRWASEKPTRLIETMQKAANQEAARLPPLQVP